MKFEAARDFALSLPCATEEPHFDMTSWRVNRKIFATVPVGRKYLHVFVDSSEAKACAEEDPAAYEELWWGKKLSGVRINIAKAKKKQVLELLQDAWRSRAPKRLQGSFDEG